jgi:hypothetical protein
MKRWAYVVATLYVLILAALTLPVAAIAFGKWPSLKDGVNLLLMWPVWLILFVLQFGLLTVCVRRSGLRPPTHWTKWPSILASGFMMAGLVQGAGLALWELFRLQSCSLLLLLSVGPAAMLLWSLVYFRLGRKVTPSDLVSHQCRTLFKSSIFALVIVVPAHIVASHRAELFAGCLTFLGFAMGLTVGLFSFGPTVLIRWGARWRRFDPAAPTDETDPTPDLMSRTATPVVAFGVLVCALLALGLSFVVQPAPTDEKKSWEFVQGINQGLNEGFEKRGWVRDGKGGWTSDTNRMQRYKELNAEMEKAGWITVSNGVYTLPADSEHLGKLRKERSE